MKKEEIEVRAKELWKNSDDKPEQELFIDAFTAGYQTCLSEMERVREALKAMRRLLNEPITLMDRRAICSELDKLIQQLTNEADRNK